MTLSAMLEDFVLGQLYSNYLLYYLYIYYVFCSSWRFMIPEAVRVQD